MCELIQYIRNKKNQPIGIVIGALVMEGDTPRVSVGWSQLNRKAGDKWNSDRAKDIAWGRAYLGSDEPIPFAAQRTYDRMVDRSIRYFKKAPASWVKID